MTERRDQGEDWRERLGREFDRPPPDSTPPRSPRPQGGAPRGAGGDRQMFPAVCAQCGRDTEVPFQPRSGQPVYCPDCFRGRQGGADPSRAGGRAPASSRPHGATPPRRAASGLPEGYLRGGYFDDDGHLRPELIVEQARAISEDLAQAGLTTAALRRFFGMARKVESRLDAEPDFAAVRGDLLALKPFAANAQTREVIPSLFREFVDRNVEQAVSGEREFRRGFLPHFQYVVAWFPRK
jgi:CxxC-x17-CxxC domain-containing protein